VGSEMCIRDRTISYEYLTNQLRVLTPALHRGMRMAGRFLPARTRRKYRQVNIGEFLVLARVAGAQDAKAW